MIEYKNLILIGTSHISPESIALVRRTIQERNPKYVAVELDRGRFHGLMHPESRKKKRMSFQEFKKLGASGFLFALFGAWIEEKLGKMVGTKPGAEMKTAIHEAAKVQAKILLIDQEISITIRRLFKTLTWKEKMRFAGDLVKGLFGFGEKIAFDLRKVPKEELIDKLVEQVRNRYPSFYKVLIEERNIFMAKRLHVAMEKYPDVIIVAIVGAGHQKGIYEYITNASSPSSS
ncbi:MAG: TraB/GumN family protein [bacterium]|nr:TraB/GumN family protein [bacterium]